MPETTRVDKWLWTVRVFKTRSLATEACRNGHVLVNGLPAKASHFVRPGEIIKVRKPPIYRSYQVIETSGNRVGARDVGKLMADVTPPEELKLLEMRNSMQSITRDRGTGRPTKKERRDLDAFFDF